MITIKGGVTILPNSENKEFMGKLKKAGGAVKLPFTATGFKCSNIPKGVNLSGIVFADSKKKGIKRPDLNLTGTKKKKNPKKKSLKNLLRR